MNETATHDAPLQVAQPPARAQAAKPKRLPRQLCNTPPLGAQPLDAGMPLGWSVSVVPVSAVAKHWGISSRRVRMMLEQGRLAGRQMDNGYWEVFYPYRYVFGTRGPSIKRLKQLQALPPKPKKWERKED